MDADVLDEVLLEKLRFWRHHIARKNRFEAYRVLPNKTLEEIATKKPKDETELLAVKGVGPNKLKTYGAELLSLIAEHEKNPSPTPEAHVEMNEIKVSVLRVRLEGEKSGDLFQSIWLETDRGPSVLLLLGDHINRYKKDDRLLVRGYTITRAGPPAFMKLLKGGEITVLKTQPSEAIDDIEYVSYSDDESEDLFTQKNSKIVEHGKLNHIRMNGLQTMPKSETDIRYTIYQLKQEGDYVLQVSNGFRRHHFRSQNLGNLREVAEDEDILYGIIVQTLHGRV